MILTYPVIIPNTNIDFSNYTNLDWIIMIILIIISIIFTTLLFKKIMKGKLKLWY